MNTPKFMRFESLYAVLIGEGEGECGPLREEQMILRKINGPVKVTRLGSRWSHSC